MDFHTTPCPLFSPQAGAEASVADGAGMTAMHLAAGAGSLGCLQTLLGAGASASPHPERERGATPLYLALESGHNDVVKALLDGGADVGEPVCAAQQLSFFNSNHRVLCHWRVFETHARTSLIPVGSLRQQQQQQPLRD